MDTKNVNRGLQSFASGKTLFPFNVLACNIFADIPFELKKFAAMALLPRTVFLAVLPKAIVGAV
jgi:hypothetical protein